MTTTYLVTGGSGFIGSNFVRFLLEYQPGVRVVNLDLLTYAGNPANLADVSTHPYYTFVQGDICDLSLVNEVVSQGVNVIVNFAAESHVDRSIADPAIFVRTNVLGTQVLLDAAVRHKIQKFVQISTDEVYGSLGPEGYFTEDTPLAPNSPYSASKAGADMIVRAYHHTFGLPVNITRCSNNYGPYQFPEKLIPFFITRALSNEPLPLYGDGQNVRDWLHVEDHCRAIDLVVRHGKPGEVYNIGGNSEMTNLSITRQILAALGRQETLIHFVTDRPGHDRRYAIDATKIQQELDWRPRRRFTEGLDQTIRWYLDNESWWRPLFTRSS